ncbi:MAG: ThuA domain-containing protein [Fimbriimonadaceae bacterium]|nr:ThuA domain-containing protein [Fimbriimonadaceae bacterium]
MKILVFSKTAGFRHDSIPTGIETLKALGSEGGWETVATEDSDVCADAGLRDFRVIVFLNTTGDILNREQQEAMERFIRRGNGFVGIHAAADTEYGWEWYGRLVGAYFRSHPHIQPAKIWVVDRTHPSTKHLGLEWNRTDEWYDYRSVPAAGTRILLKLDPASYQGHTMGDDHPIAWCAQIDGGRSWYTGGGHTKESFAEPDFRRHLLGGIRWAGRLED